MSINTRLSSQKAILLKDLSMTSQTRIFFDELLQEIDHQALIFGTGSPEGVVEAVKGKTYQDDTGTAGNIRYAKQVDDVAGDKSLGWISV